MTSLQKLAAETAQQFVKTYGRPPRWIVAAPGRVNVIGEHIDYNDGFVLPMAIEHYAVMAADRSADGKSVMQIRDTSGAEPLLVDLSVPVQPGVPKWGNYPRGVIAGFLELRHQSRRAGCAAAFHRAAGRRIVQQRGAGSGHRHLDRSRGRQEN